MEQIAVILKRQVIQSHWDVIVCHWRSGFCGMEEHDHLILEGEGNIFLKIAVNHLHSGTASYCSRLEYLVTPLWKPPNPQLVILSHFKRSYKCGEYLSVFVHPTPVHY